MKKIMIAIGAIALAVGVQAATVSWGSGIMKSPESASGGWSTTTVTSGDVAGYLFILTADQYATYSGNSAAIYNDFTAGKITADASKNTGTAITLKTPKTDYTVGDTVYAAILYVNKDVEGFANVKEFYMADASTWTFAAASNKTFSNVATGIGSWTAVAVPEPTSGILMLVGLAGLALRRRRA